MFDVCIGNANEEVLRRLHDFEFKTLLSLFRNG
jgi:hypothetical protein